MFGYPVFSHIILKKILAIKDVASFLIDDEYSIKRSSIYLIFLFIILAICICAMFFDTESEHGNKGLEWFGAYVTSVERGALITSIIPNSPAQKSGLMAGDIIVYVDRERIKNAGSLRKEIIDIKPNQRFNITVIRNGRWEVLSVRYGNNI